MSIASTTNPVTKRDYHCYDNGFYELDKIHRKNGTIEQIKRTITGPIPANKLQAILRNIDINSPHWETSVINRLTLENFYTNRIVTRIPRGCGMTKVKYLSSKITIENGALLAIVIIVFASPGILATLSPDTAKKAGMKLIKGSIISYSFEHWKAKIPKSIFKSNFMRNVSMVACISSGAVLFNKLTADIGPKNFRAWQAAKFEVLYEEKTIPSQHVNDPVLNEISTECPIGLSLIRTPIRCNCQVTHTFEEAALKAWVVQSVANEVQQLQVPCPMSRIPLLNIDNNTDYALSDTIELRLALLG